MPRRKHPLVEIPCQMCKKMFLPASKRGNKCSAICRKQWYREEDRKRNAKRSVKLSESHTKKSCFVCDKVFRGNRTRVTCSRECSKEYVNSGDASREHVRRNKKIIPEKIVVFTFRDITEEDLKVDRDPSVTEAIIKFKREGGQVQILASEPSPKIPSVDSKNGDGWDWQALYGAGTYTGVADYVDYYSSTININFGE